MRRASVRLILQCSSIQKTKKNWMMKLTSNNSSMQKM